MNDNGYAEFSAQTWEAMINGFKGYKYPVIMVLIGINRPPPQ